MATVVSAAIAAMRAKGIASDDILDVVAAMAEAQSDIGTVVAVDSQAERRRAKDRDRKRLRNSAESAETIRPLPKKEIPPTPPKEKTTLPNPTQEANASLVAPTTGPKAVQVAFDEFWEAYPQRDGANPRKPAFKKFAARVRSGADPEAIIAAAGRYAAELRAKGRVATPYVAQAATWLNQDRFDDYAAPPPAANGASAAPGFVVVMPGTEPWQAWFDHKQSVGEKVGLMKQRAAEGLGYQVPSEYPPEPRSEAA